MKQPSDTAAGAKRKTLPTRKARKQGTAPVLKKPAKRKRILRKGSDQELVRIFGEK